MNGDCMQQFRYSEEMQTVLPNRIYSSPHSEQLENRAPQVERRGTVWGVPHNNCFLDGQRVQSSHSLGHKMRHPDIGHYPRAPEMSHTVSHPDISQSMGSVVAKPMPRRWTPTKGLSPAKVRVPPKGLQQRPYPGQQTQGFRQPPAPAIPPPGGLSKTRGFGRGFGLSDDLHTIERNPRASRQSPWGNTQATAQYGANTLGGRTGITHYQGHAARHWDDSWVRPLGMQQGHCIPARHDSSVQWGNATPLQGPSQCGSSQVPWSSMHQLLEEHNQRGSPYWHGGVAVQEPKRVPQMPQTVQSRQFPAWDPAAASRQLPALPLPQQQSTEALMEVVASRAAQVEALAKHNAELWAAIKPPGGPLPGQPATADDFLRAQAMVLAQLEQAHHTLLMSTHTYIQEHHNPPNPPLMLQETLRPASSSPPGAQEGSPRLDPGPWGSKKPRSSTTRETPLRGNPIPKPPRKPITALRWKVRGARSIRYCSSVGRTKLKRGRAHFAGPFYRRKSQNRHAASLQVKMPRLKLAHPKTSSLFQGIRMSTSSDLLEPAAESPPLRPPPPAPREELPAPEAAPTTDLPASQPPLQAQTDSLCLGQIIDEAGSGEATSSVSNQQCPESQRQSHTALDRAYSVSSGKAVPCPEPLSAIPQSACSKPSNPPIEAPPSDAQPFPPQPQPHPDIFVDLTEALPALPQTDPITLSQANHPAIQNDEHPSEPSSAQTSIATRPAGEASAGSLCIAPPHVPPGLPQEPQEQAEQHASHTRQEEPSTQQVQAAPGETQAEAPQLSEQGPLPGPRVATSTSREGTAADKDWAAVLREMTQMPNTDEDVAVVTEAWDLVIECLSKKKAASHTLSGPPTASASLQSSRNLGPLPANLSGRNEDQHSLGSHCVPSLWKSVAPAKDDSRDGVIQPSESESLPASPKRPRRTIMPQRWIPPDDSAPPSAAEHDDSSAPAVDCPPPSLRADSGKDDSSDGDSPGPPDVPAWFFSGEQAPVVVPEEQAPVLVPEECHGNQTQDRPGDVTDGVQPSANPSCTVVQESGQKQAPATRLARKRRRGEFSGGVENIQGEPADIAICRPDNSQLTVQKAPQEDVLEKGENRGPFPASKSLRTKPVQFLKEANAQETLETDARAHEVQMDAGNDASLRRSIRARLPNHREDFYSFEELDEALKSPIQTGVANAEYSLPKPKVRGKSHTSKAGSSQRTAKSGVSLIAHCKRNLENVKAKITESPGEKVKGGAPAGAAMENNQATVRKRGPGRPPKHPKAQHLAPALKTTAPGTTMKPAPKPHFPPAGPVSRKCSIGKKGQGERLKQASKILPLVQGRARTAQAVQQTANPKTRSVQQVSTPKAKPGRKPKSKQAAVRRAVVPGVSIQVTQVQLAGSMVNVPMLHGPYLPDSFCPLPCSERYPRRIPGGNHLQSSSFTTFIQRIRLDSRHFQAQGRILRCKQYMKPDANCAMMDEVISALAVNTRVEVLYIQNYERGMLDDQLRRLTNEVLKRRRIWALNIGENFNISHEAWQEFTDALKETCVAFMYVSEHHLMRTDLKIQMKDAIRKNRRNLELKDTAMNELIKNMWFNPAAEVRRRKEVLLRKQLEAIAV